MLWATQVLSFITGNFSDHGHKARSPAKNRTSAKKQLLQNVLYVILSFSKQFMRIVGSLHEKQASSFRTNQVPQPPRRSKNMFTLDALTLRNHFSYKLMRLILFFLLSLLPGHLPTALTPRAHPEGQRDACSRLVRAGSDPESDCLSQSVLKPSHGTLRQPQTSPWPCPPCTRSLIRRPGQGNGVPFHASDGTWALARLQRPQPWKRKQGRILWKNNPCLQGVTPPGL